MLSEKASSKPRKIYNSVSHSSGTFVGCVVGDSEYVKCTPSSPPPCLRGVILNAKRNNKLDLFRITLLAEPARRMPGLSAFLHVYVGAVPRTARNFRRVQGNAPYLRISSLLLFAAGYWWNFCLGEANTGPRNAGPVDWIAIRCHYY